MTTRIKDYSCTQVGEDAKGHRQWIYTESRAWGYETISFWSLPGDYPTIGDTIEDNVLVKSNKDSTGSQ